MNNLRTPRRYGTPIVCTNTTSLGGNLPPTAADLARLKTAFAAAIADGIEGAASLRAALLAAYHGNSLTADAVPAALDMLADMRTAQRSPAATPEAPAEVPFRKGMVVTNAAGQIVRLYESKAGRLYAKVRVDGSWEYESGAMRGVRHLTADEAKAYGDATDHCVFCGLALEDPRSTSVGYGPVCADHYGLPWGTK